MVKYVQSGRTDLAAVLTNLFITTKKAVEAAAAAATQLLLLLLRQRHHFFCAFCASTIAIKDGSVASSVIASKILRRV